MHPTYIQDVKQWAGLAGVRPLELQRFARSVNDAVLWNLRRDLDL
jgi:hypothetical protein